MRSFSYIVLLGLAVTWLGSIGAEESRIGNRLVLEMGYLSAPLGLESWFNAEVAAFERTYPNIDVKLIQTTSPSRKQEPIETLASLPANVIGIDSEPGYEVQYLVDRGAIIPLDEFLAEDPSPTFSLDDFYPNVLASAMHQGKIWGIPWLAWNQVLVCDMEVFKEAGLSETPKSWDDVLTYASVIRNLSLQEGKPEYWGMHITTRGDSMSHTCAAIALQQGEFFKDGKFDFDTSAVRFAITTLQSLIIQSGAVRVDDKTIAEVLAESETRYGMHLAENFELNEVLGHRSLRVVPLPTNGEPVSAGFRRAYLGVRRSTPELEAASYDLVKWFARPDVSFPKSLVGVPCRRDFVERADFLKLASRSLAGMDVLYSSAQKSVEPTPPIMGRYQAFDHLAAIAQQAIAGAISIDQFVFSATETSNRFIQPLSGLNTELSLYD